MLKQHYKDVEKTHFDGLARKYRSQWWGSKTVVGQSRYQIRAGYALKAIGNDAHRILEIGCSAGDFTKCLLSLPNSIKELVAIDISPELIALAIEKVTNPAVKFMVADIENIDYPDGYFDAIVGNAILHHLNLDYALPELKRILRVEGKIFFTEPNMLNPQIFLERKVKFIGKILQNSPGETAFVRSRIKKLLELHGFKNAMVRNFDFIHPAMPRITYKYLKSLSSILETIPLVKEVSGSLMITAQKADSYL